MKHFAEVGDLDKGGTPPMACMAARGNNIDDWVIDSGSTEHITYKAEILQNMTQNQTETPVVIPNGNAIPVEGR